MYAHWQRYPPVHVTAALFAGIKPGASSQARPPGGTREGDSQPKPAWLAELPMVQKPRAGATERAAARAKGLIR